jgi:hypothetical protein
LSQKRQFFRWNFRRKYLKDHNIKFRSRIFRLLFFHSKSCVGNNFDQIWVGVHFWAIFSTQTRSQWQWWQPVWICRFYSLKLLLKLYSEKGGNLQQQLTTKKQCVQNFFATLPNDILYLMLTFWSIVDLSCWLSENVPFENKHC